MKLSKQQIIIIILNIICFLLFCASHICMAIIISIEKFRISSINVILSFICYTPYFFFVWLSFSKILFFNKPFFATKKSHYEIKNSLIGANMFCLLITNNFILLGIDSFISSINTIRDIKQGFSIVIGLSKETFIYILQTSIAQSSLLIVFSSFTIFSCLYATRIVFKRYQWIEYINRGTH